MNYILVCIMTVYLVLGCNTKSQNNPFFFSSFADSILNLVHNPSNTHLSSFDCAPSYDSSKGYVYILNSYGLSCERLSVPSGEQLSVLAYPPANARFADYLLIWKDLTPQELSNYQNGILPPQTKHMDSKDITEISDLRPTGSAYQMSISTLNWSPGTYTLAMQGDPQTQYPTVTENVTISSVVDSTFNNIINDMITNNRDAYIYSNGNPVSSSSKLYRGNTYVFALNLNKIKTVKNEVSVDYIKLLGGFTLNSGMLKLRLVPTNKKSRISTECSTTSDFPVSISNYPQGILTVRFQTPPSIKFYHADENIFSFKIYHNAPSDCSSGSNKTTEFSRNIIDLHTAETPIPVNAAGPLDTIKIRIVRFGDTQFTTNDSLTSWGNILTSEFYEATKKYFKLEIQGIQNFSMIQPDLNQALVENWYNTRPKTPGKTPLNLNNPDERLLATMLYYEFNQTKLLTDLEILYPIRQNGEDVTLYISDFSKIQGGAYATSNAQLGQSIVPITNVYLATYSDANIIDTRVFHTITNGTTTFHFDPTFYQPCLGCPPSVANATEYVEVMRQRNLQYTSQNISIHELGHTSWHHKMGGIRVGDFPEPGRPFDQHYEGARLMGSVYDDNSIDFFRNMEYMSSKRLREILNQTYGDILIERLLSRYGVNFRSHKYTFVPTNPHNANFGGITQADGYCNLDSNKPSKLLSLGGGYKAMLVGDTRRASLSPNAGDGQIDWVLKPLQEYRRSDDTIIGTTNSVGLFSFPFQNSFAGNYAIWTGLDQTWKNKVISVNQLNCLNWTSSSTNELGAFGLANWKYGNSIFVGQGICSKTSLPDHTDPYNWKDVPASILCVEQ
ncbi:extracellular matrix-binding protein Lp95 [Leptospira interrogans]|uniref:Lipoprotein n=1 Tax=Leptospira interrogans serogroup Icterohaemorrhagiae serovar Lai (strain 56601) TaxID=189518 RepID=Q8F7I3_LEPIN|nr:DUF1554 domain-containing protein [Leptospira interrogans]AAN48161.1 putative lipoprotein [Leptospira interrogans serovar Lai str. 56601]AER01589.1 putative lipoprotein [Leptospira interrogans serovar Lai str. IPAV]MCR8637302.1 hypothetical protein [Leptospira interrogans serovar Ricardi]